VKTYVAANNTSEVAKRRLLSIRGEPLFFADWKSALFIHYEADPQKLQECVPYEIDLYHGRAFVSVVAFRMHRMRPRFGGRFTKLLFQPVTDSHFLNVRTYVRQSGESGIYFMSEWLSNRLSVLLGPWTFGLPYRSGRLDYKHEHEINRLSGAVAASEGRLTYRASWKNEFEISERDSLTEFLLERYTAFTEHRRRKRFFRIWHEPWHQVPLDIDVPIDDLIGSTGDWWRSARCAGGNYSPGVKVWMGWPHRIYL
jgi:uncharacterized protein YqjF (DUF2071 family)